MKRATIITLAGLFSLTTFLACYWDHDTLQMETREFPEALDLITGNFLRHSPEFYEWRVKDRETQLQQSLHSSNVYDDLAVAYSKLKRDEEAITVALKKDSLFPEQYETYANLGTFYIHNGELEKGIEYIDKAIGINPDAHFGREVYQRYLAEYIISKSDSSGMQLPLDTFMANGYDWEGSPNNFYFFLLNKHNASLSEDEKVRVLPRDKQEKTVKGILGMMKFGNYDSPVLLEVLGDMLLYEFDNNDQDMDQGARQLAFMAYTKASRSVDGPAKRYYERKARAAIVNQKFNEGRSDDVKAQAEHLTKVLDDAIARADEFYQDVRQNEIDWINNGQNPEIEFDKEYYGITPKPHIMESTEQPQKGVDEESNLLLYILLGLGVTALGALILRKVVKKS